VLQALNTFVQQMSLSGKEFMSRKQLVDLLVSYHFIPGEATAHETNCVACGTQQCQQILVYMR
jgi:hypothetical protein